MGVLMAPEPIRVQERIRFGEGFELEAGARRLCRGGQALKLERIPLEILVLLVEHRGEIVTRDEIVAKVWGKGAFLDTDNSIRGAIRKIRQVLKDDTEYPRFIQTVTGHGYRFIASVISPQEGNHAEASKDPPSTAPKGLPLHRHFPDKRGSVYALISKLDAWLRRRTLHLEEEEEEERSEPPRDANVGHGTTGTSRVAFGLLAIVGITAVLFALNVHGWRDRLFVRAAKPRIQALAVLPLANLSGNPEQEYFADGMTEALITEVGKTSIPRVISRQSVMQFKGTKKPLQEIARELNVDAVLEGAVEHSGDRVRISIHLDQVSPEGQLWSNQYDRDIHDVLPLQDEIARRVADEIRVKLTPEERTRLTTAHSVSPQAHDDYLRGRYILGLALTHQTAADKRQYTDLDILAAIAHFKHAIEKDPAYAMAHAGLADAYILLGNPLSGHSPKETLSDAKEAATKALELDPSLTEAHFALAQTLEYDWNWSEAEKEFKLALKLNPNYADAHLEYGRFVQALGRNDEAMKEMNYAMELNPFDIKTRVVVAYVTWASHQYDIALQQFTSLGDDWGLVWTYREKQMYPEALAALERWKSSHPTRHRNPSVLATAASIYGLEGRKQQAEKLIDELREMARRQYVSGFFFAEAYVGIGQKDQAVTWLERAYDEHDQWMVYIASYPGLDRLHSEPRFQALLRRMNFPQ
jgi:TolB-like protein/DNA-binding winged helix-turn-helix (wHTH) protein/Tfp pilus assembly protein PilF